MTRTRLDARSLSVVAKRLTLGPDRRAALHALFDVVLVTQSLKKGGYRRLVAAGDAKPSVPPVSAERGKELATIVDEAFGAVPITPTCLRRSAALMRALEREGAAPPLMLGVRSTDGTIGAHAWVEIGGIILNDDPDLIATYSVISSGELEKALASLR